MKRFVAIFWRLCVFFSLISVFLPGMALARHGMKTDDDDPAINVRGAVVNRILDVLRTSPDSAGDKCVNTLADMHKAQDQLEEVEKHDDDPDIGLVRDVLASDMEDAVTECGGDAQLLCHKKAWQDPALAKLCASLPGAEEREERGK